MPPRHRRPLAALLGVALLIAGCEPGAPSPAGTTAAPSPSPSPSPSVSIPRRSPRATPPASAEADLFLACATGADGGLDDRHVNAEVYRGLARLVDRRGIRVEFIESPRRDDYEERLAGMVARGCDAVVAVGAPLRQHVLRAAIRERGLPFVVVEGEGSAAPDNVLGLVFRQEEAAVLAGYLAAGVSESGRIGTYVAPSTPLAASLARGLALGARLWSERHREEVRVLGWDARAERPLLFIRDSADRRRGRLLSDGLLRDGADVLVPFAGLASLGAAAAAQDARAEGVVYIGTDSDQFSAAPEYGDVTLTSVVRRVDLAVEAAVEAALDGSFAGGTYVGDLANGGVGLAPYHELEGRVPPSLRRELDELRDRIVGDGIEGVADAVDDVAPAPSGSREGADPEVVDGRLDE